MPNLLHTSHRFPQNTEINYKNEEKKSLNNWLPGHRFVPFLRKRKANITEEAELSSRRLVADIANLQVPD